MEDIKPDNKWNILNHDVTSAQIITSIIVGAILLLLVILNILVYVSYRRAVKSYHEIMERNKNMAANFQSKMGNLFHRKGQSLDDSNISGTSTTSRTRSSEASSLPRKQSLDNEIISSSMTTETQEPKHKSILKKHPEHESAELKSVPERKHSSPHLFGFLHHKSDNSKHEAKRKHGKCSPSLIKANTKKNGQRLPLTGEKRSQSVENLFSGDKETEKVHHSGPVKRVSLVASEKQIEDISRINQRHRQANSSPIVTEFRHIDINDESTKQSSGNKDNQPIQSNVLVNSARFKEPETSAKYVLSHYDLQSRRDKGHNSSVHPTRVVVSDLKHIDFKKDLEESTENDFHLTESTTSFVKVSKIPTPISNTGSQYPVDNFQRKGHNSNLPPTISDFKHVELDGHNQPQIKGNEHFQSKGHNSKSPATISDIIPETSTKIQVKGKNSRANSPLHVQVTEMEHIEIEEEISQARGNNSETAYAVICDSTTEIHEEQFKGDNYQIETNVSTDTDTIGSLEAAMKAEKTDYRYGEIEIVDNSSISRLRRPKSEDSEFEFQNLAFEKTVTETETDLGTFYVSDVEL